MATKMSILMHVCTKRVGPIEIVVHICTSMFTCKSFSGILLTITILRNKPNKQLANIMQVLYYKSYGQGATTCDPISTARHTVNYVAYVRRCPVSHDEKNMTLGRPMSPHLTIYGPTVPAMTSIAQRATGIALSALSFILAAVELFYPGGTCAAIKYIHKLVKSSVPEVVIIALKALLAWVFLYHYICGVRFVFFNLAKGLHLKTAYKTAWTAIALSILGAAAAALLGHMY